jgi:hypothetical protein
MAAPAASRTRDARAFVFRGGVRVTGTVVACDAGARGDLVFLSHAPALGARGRRAIPRIGSGRRQLLATETTLALLGPAEDPLRAHALVAVYGRPFSLGGLRLEVFRSGFMPGAASLLVESEGRRLVYAGPIGAGADVEVRAADALCIDARHAALGLELPPRDEAMEALGRAVREVLAAGGAPVVVADSVGLALVAADALAADRVALRAHRAIMLAAAAHARAGIPVPTLSRFGGRMAPGEVLLWPAGTPVPAPRRGGRRPGLVLVGPGAIAAAGAQPGPAAVPLAEGVDRLGLERYIAAVGAAEVALANAPDGELVQALRRRGIDAYSLGPPRQGDLFSAHAA